MIGTILGLLILAVIIYLIITPCPFGSHDYKTIEYSDGTPYKLECVECGDIEIIEPYAGIGG